MTDKYLELFTSIIISDLPLKVAREVVLRVDVRVLAAFLEAFPEALHEALPAAFLQLRVRVDHLPVAVEVAAAVAAKVLPQLTVAASLITLPLVLRVPRHYAAADPRLHRRQTSTA